MSRPWVLGWPLRPLPSHKRRTLGTGRILRLSPFPRSAPILPHCRGVGRPISVRLDLGKAVTRPRRVPRPVADIGIGRASCLGVVADWPATAITAGITAFADIVRGESSLSPDSNARSGLMDSNPRPSGVTVVGGASRLVAAVSHEATAAVQTGESTRA
jgi:hypothetical protein